MSLFSRWNPFATSPAASFPNDENGDVLRQMQECGDDLRMPRDIDFTVVFPDEAAARAFGDHFRGAGYRVSVERSDIAEGRPWDVEVVKFMHPEHGGITRFEQELEAVATRFGGRNAGWGCFEQ